VHAVEFVVSRYRDSASSAFDTSTLQEKLSFIRGTLLAFAILCFMLLVCRCTSRCSTVEMFDQSLRWFQDQICLTVTVHMHNISIYTSKVTTLADLYRNYQTFPVWYCTKHHIFSTAFPCKLEVWFHQCCRHVTLTAILPGEPEFASFLLTLLLHISCLMPSHPACPSQTGEGTAVKEEEWRESTFREGPNAIPVTNQCWKHSRDLILSSTTNRQLSEGTSLPLKHQYHIHSWAHVTHMESRAVSPNVMVMCVLWQTWRRQSTGPRPMRQLTVTSTVTLTTLCLSTRRRLQVLDSSALRHSPRVRRRTSWLVWPTTTETVGLHLTHAHN